MNLESYTTAKNSVGWRVYPTDVVVARGNDRLDLLQRLTTNDVSKLTGGSPSGEETRGFGVQNVLLTDKARIIDVFTVLARPNDVLMLFSDGFGAKAVEWLDKYTFIDDFQTQTLTPNYASILLFGPRSLQLLEELGQKEASLNDLRIGSWQHLTLNSSSMQSVEVIVVRQQQLCEFCYLVLVPQEAHGMVLAALRGLNNVAEIDDETFEILRIEAAWGKHGAEWTDERNPLEAGLVGLVDFKKGCYIGQEVIARLDTYNKVKVRLSGVRSDVPIPVNARFFDEADGKRTDIGGVTSSTFSPDLNKHIALAYIRSAFANPGANIHAASEGYEAKLEIVKLPFVM